MWLRRLICHWYGHRWASSLPSRFHCTYVACTRCGIYKTIHATEQAPTELFDVGVGCVHVGPDGQSLAGATTWIDRSNHP